ncbi:molybdate ABC transporter substrate-binding protein [Myxococcus sp. K15C18031901]|uniref:molybdate ABC transporter substrate-binding protein n=1 Tax=Myxococcus dinghuensis TaxID=2906761 RepID=UPI0020A74509|nr:molybdate ABC transporter substrate-binding protein [Myxococcus dinghuensis]MCP3100649.1 molybdate ABC transporter substrate-binding protein [Myxococcus dinghuensis]
MRALLLLCVSLVAFRATPARAEEGLVFAAASTTDVLQELQPAFTKATGHTVKFAFGASSDLARQAMAGAPADAFLSADEARMDAVERAGLLRPGTRVDLLSNRLVVVVPSDAKQVPKGPGELKSLRRLALADPAMVPAGVYARAWLEKVGLWTALSPKVVPALDVRAALAAVESGRVDAGVVYATDAAQSKKVRVAFEVPAPDAPRIVYPAAALVKGKAPAVGQAFVTFLQTDVARAAFARHGFGMAGGAKQEPRAP